MNLLDIKDHLEKKALNLNTLIAPALLGSVGANSAGEDRRIAGAAVGAPAGVAGFMAGGLGTGLLLDAVAHKIPTKPLRYLVERSQVPMALAGGIGAAHLAGKAVRKSNQKPIEKKAYYGIAELGLASGLAGSIAGAYGAGEDRRTAGGTLGMPVGSLAGAASGVASHLALDEVGHKIPKKLHGAAGLIPLAAGLVGASGASYLTGKLTSKPKSVEKKAGIASELAGAFVTSGFSPVTIPIASITAGLSKRKDAEGMKKQDSKSISNFIPGVAQHRLMKRVGNSWSKPKDSDKPVKIK